MALYDDEINAERDADLVQAKKTIDALVAAGAALANCAHNLAQNDKLSARDRISLEQCYKAWDAAALALAKEGSDGI